LVFVVEIKKRALKSIELLDIKRKQSLRETIDVLKDDPVPFRRMDVIKLRGHDNVYRVRMGELRLVYGVQWDERKILIHYVEHRGNVYSTL
jgi:mRNA interferase RelE/StbE